jgi:CheY-like chemotaxis protein
MDIQMPEMDGYEATRQIRSVETAQHTKIIALTASAFEDDLTRALTAGCDDFVAKPLKADLILEKMSEHLGVQYVYDEVNAKSVNEPLESAAINLSPSTLTVMPTEWITQLHQATTQLNSQKMLALVDQIPLEHAVLSEALQQKINTFDFEQIMQVTQQVLDEEE